jgi:hypothetical protein
MISPYLDGSPHFRRSLRRSDTHHRLERVQDKVIGATSGPDGVLHFAQIFILSLDIFQRGEGSRTDRLVVSRGRPQSRKLHKVRYTSDVLWHFSICRTIILLPWDYEDQSHC